MVTLLEREFTVNLPLDQAWDHLARIEQWPSWARHIRRIDLQPPSDLGPTSTGKIYLTNGIKTAFRVTEFNPPRNWQWVGSFLWLTVHYDHVFEALDAAHTKMTFLIQAQGFGATILGPLFARVYRPSLDRAIPRLIHEVNAAACVSGAGKSGD
jgi:hypothetical protein